MSQLILVRHGQSLWNQQNIFTGWVDVDLSEQGVQEAVAAGQLLRSHGIVVDEAHTSYLQRAIKTLHLMLEEMDQLWIPEYKSWRLNERHYGALQGKSKEEMAKEVGAEQVHIWRRSYDVPPPPLERDDPMHPARDKRYADLPLDQLPDMESLHQTVMRVLAYYQAHIFPALQAGKTVLVAAHGNSLRGLLKHLLEISDEDIVGLEIPTGKPMVITCDADVRVVRHAYLGE